MFNMSNLLKYAFSSVGQKQLMAVSGIGWALFVLSHMAGNLLIFAGAEVYNKYSHSIVSNPGIYLMEAALLFLLLTHIVFAISVSIKNSKAKSGGIVPSSGDKGTSFIAKTMKYQGILILLFIIIHLVSFKFGTVYHVTYDTVEIRDIFRLVVEKFQSFPYVSFYCVTVLILGFHLSNGISSSLQSLGLYSVKYDSMVRKFSFVYGMIVGVGFCIPPIYLYLKGPMW